MNINPSFYDHVILSYSGGKDSAAMICHLLENGFEKRQIELWHQAVDGKGVKNGLMDWPITEGYVNATSRCLGLPLFYQWRDGGFEGEMLRENAPTGAVYFEKRNGTPFTSKVVKLDARRSSNGTRLQFPQVSADLSVRWCSAYLKIDVAARALNNDPRFLGKHTLFVTGERREESTARSKYLQFEEHRCHGKKRLVHHYRPVIDYTEEQIWDTLRRHHIRPHPAYYLGFGRVSCMKCIFGMYDQWATIKELDADGLHKIAEYEDRFGKTIKRGQSVREQANRGKSTIPHGPERDLFRNLALGHEYPDDLFLTGDDWVLPCGAFKHTGGPT